MILLSSRIRRNLVQSINGAILFDEPIKNHTSFRIGGPADAFVVPNDEIDLKNLLKFVNKNGVSLTVIGNGTKLLVSDEGMDGITIKLSGCFNDILVSKPNVKAGAGFSLSNLSATAANCGLSGLEFAIRIPGTVGGGVVMNAGAHGCMISDVVTSIRAMHPTGQLKEYSKTNLKFGYRQSIFQINKEIILGVEMKLKNQRVEEIKKRIDEYIQWRKENQPLNLPNVGSIFKNPPSIPAGRLIELAGLKGMRVGNAKISEKHANFIVNLGNATANDVQHLIDITRKTVLKKYDIMLEPEIIIVGRSKEDS